MKNKLLKNIHEEVMYVNYINNVRIICLLLFVLFLFQTSIAQGDGARSQLLAPVGVWGLKVKWVHLNQNLVPSGNILVPGSKIKVDVFPTTLFHTFALKDRFAQILFTAVPGYSSAKFNSGTSDVAEEFDASGFGDGFLGIKLGLIGAPALINEEFSNRERNYSLFGFFRLWYPGTYDPSEVLNMGTNRFTFELGAPMSFPIGSKHSKETWVEVFPSICFFTDNNDYSVDEGEEKLEQKPVFLLENHVTHTFNKTIWGGLDLRYQYGGQTVIGGENQGNQQNILSGGVVLGFKVFSFLDIYTNYGRILVGDNEANSEMLRISVTLKNL